MDISRIKEALASCDIHEGVDYYATSDTIHIYAHHRRIDPPTVLINLDPFVERLNDDIKQMSDRITQMIESDFKPPEFGTKKPQEPYYKKFKRGKYQ